MWGALTLLDLAGGLVAVAAGAGLAWSGARRPGARHFAAFAALWGAHVAALAIAGEMGAPEGARLLAGGAVALLLASIPFLAAFVAAFPTRASPRWTFAGLAGSAALAAWFLLSYESFRPVARAGAPTLALGPTAVVGLLIPLIALLAVGAARAVAASRRADGALAQEARLATWGLVPALAFALAAFFAPAPWSRLGGLAGGLAAAVVAFAIVKHHVINLGVALHQTAARGVILAIFGGAFFAVDQVAQIYVSDRFGALAGDRVGALAGDRVGALAGLVAALLLVFALAPIRRFSERLAERFFPTESGAELEARKSVVYRAAAQAAMKDGTVTESEREMLDALVRELELPPAEAAQIEREVLGQVAG